MSIKVQIGLNVDGHSYGWGKPMDITAEDVDEKLDDLMSDFRDVIDTKLIAKNSPEKMDERHELTGLQIAEIIAATSEGPHGICNIQATQRVLGRFFTANFCEEITNKVDEIRIS